MSTRMKDKPKLIDVNDLLPDNWMKLLYKCTSPVVDKVFGINSFNHIYATRRERVDLDALFESMLEQMEVELKFSTDQIERIPSEGSLIVVANHPFGGLDGITLASLVQKRRDDFRLLVTSLLELVPEIQPWLFTVNVFGAEDARRENRKSMKQSYEWLEQGHTIITFPSGTVSFYDPKQRSITDPEWHTHIARMARRTNATVLPMHFSGHNSLFFQTAGLVNPMLRTALLAREFVAREKKPIAVKIGKPITPEKMCTFETDKAFTDYMRLCTYLDGDYPKKPVVTPLEGKRKQEALADPVAPQIIAAEIESLPADQRLVDTHQYRVVVCNHTHIPKTLLEIGRLREITYRTIGVGTGNSLDIDEHDYTYQHLILWDKTHQTLVGSYRIGFIDEMLHLKGASGIYSTSLFHFQGNTLKRLGRALEFGRSFVVEAYQRTAALSYLWRGLSIYVAKNPSCTKIIGTVSISPEYTPASLACMIQVLQDRYMHPEFAQSITGKQSPKGLSLKKPEAKIFKRCMTDINKVAHIIEHLEPEGLNIPPLLKHYLRMGCRVLGLNVDANFGNSLDALMILDLHDCNTKLLRKHMTPEYHDQFLAYHGKDWKELSF